MSPTVAELNIYPIKSCADVAVDSAPVTPRGFALDRAFQVVVPGPDGSSVWRCCTPREKAFEKLFHIKQAPSRDGKSLVLSSPHASGSFTLDLKDPPAETLVTTTVLETEVTVQDYGAEVSAWLAEATGIQNPRLVGIGGAYRRAVAVNPDQGDALPESSSPPPPVSLADEAPFLLTSRESLRDLNGRLGDKKVDMRRFRPNIVVTGMKPWEEDSLKRIRIGSVEFHVWQRCGRCIMTTIDRDTLERRGGEPLKTLGTFREREHGQRNFGMHMIPVLDGNVTGGEAKISVGDKVEILEYDEERRAEWERLFGNKASRDLLVTGVLAIIVVIVAIFLKVVRE